MKKLFLLLLAIVTGMTMSAIEQVNGVYQIGSAADLTEFANLVNGGETGANAVLTADIDGYTGPMIGTAEIMYGGTFDGQYHKLSYTTEPSEPIWSLFRTLTGTIRNLNVAGTITTAQKQVGGLVGFIYGGTIENCICAVDIQTSFSGDAGMGGFAATSMSNGSTFKNCVFSGKIQGSSANSCGGILGWITGSANATLTNCLNIGEITVSTNNGNVLTRNPGRATITNCYYQNAYGSVPSGVTQVNETQLASGEVCYLLNDDKDVTQWTQKIGDEAYPKPLPTGAQVFAVPSEGFRCDGTPLGATTYSNEYAGVSVPPHTYEAGVCRVCGQTDYNYKQPNADGAYELATAADLNWFAVMVTNGYTDINAVLTQDISDYAGTMIGTASIMYGGTFDGQYHKITYTTEPTEPIWSLFRTLTGTIRNLNVAGTITTSQKQVGGLVGFIYGGTIENCICSVDIQTSFSGDAGTGGFAATSMDTGSTFTNCVFNGKIQGSSANNCGGLLGWITGSASAILTNCLNIGEITVSTSGGNVLTRNPGRATITNCYYQNAYGSVPGGVTQVSEEQLKSGEVCYLLNDDKDVTQWTQKIGDEAYPKPLPTGAQVYAVPSEGFRCDGTPLGATTYSNKAPDITLPDHTYEAGICQVCAQVDHNYKQLNADGAYELATATDLNWFAAMVNSGENGINGVLTQDIDDYTGPMIGTILSKYAGTFDGQFYKITYTTEAVEPIWGLFRFLSGTVKNLHADGTIQTGVNECGGIAGDLYAGTIQNCICTVNILSTFTGDSAFGGLVSRTMQDGCAISDCIFAGTIQGNQHSCAGLIGWTNVATSITNCLHIGTISARTDGGNVLARNPGKATIKNCYYLNAYGDVPSGTAQVSEEQLKSGEVCYLLSSAFRQNIGYDVIPTLDPTHGIVNKIGATGYATQYIADSNVLVPEGVTAYAGLIDTPWIALRPLTNIIPAGAAVVLQGNAGYYSFIPVTVDGTVKENDLKGTAEPLETTGFQYVLAEKAGVVGFYKAEGTIPAGKAYIEYNGSAVKVFFFGEETGLKNVQSLMANGQSEALYDLSGRHVEKMQKGIYIINGKKILK